MRKGGASCLSKLFYRIYHFLISAFRQLPGYYKLFSFMQFAPTYHDYVLYNNNSDGEEGQKKYRSRTFVPTGSEMDTVRNNKHTVSNKLDEVQLSSLSSSGSSTPQHSGPTNDTKNAEAMNSSKNAEAMNSSLLMDVSNSDSVPYDITTLIDIDMSSYSPKVPSANKPGNS